MSEQNNGTVVHGFCLCEKDIGGELPNAIVTLLCQQRGYDTVENLALDYGNIMNPLQSGEEISDYMLQYIQSVNGAKYLMPPYSIIEYKETIKELGASLCVYLSVEGFKTVSNIEQTILDRAARFRELGRVDEAISCLKLGWPVADRSPKIAKESAFAKYDFAVQLRRDPDKTELADLLLKDANVTVISLLSDALSDDIDLFELQLLIAHQTADHDQKFSIYNGKEMEQVSYEEMMRAGIREFRARNGVSKEIDQIEAALYDTGKSSFFGRKA
jgi:hypothetical protein